MEKLLNLQKNNKKCTIHGLDVGNATLVNNQGLIIDAKVTRIEPIKKANKITFDNITYFLGYGNYDPEFIKTEKEYYIEMLYGLLALSTDTEDNLIGLGLPLSQYNEYKDRLIDIILMNNKKAVKLNEGIEKNIIIQDVEVFPEGICTLKDDEEGIVIDLGGGTVDCGLVVNEYDTRKVEKPITIPRGTIKLYDSFVNKLTSKGLDISLEDARRILNRGYLYKEGDIQFNDYEEFVENLISKLKFNYNLNLYPIIVTGGGGKLLYDKLKEKLPNSKLILQADAITANARNFYELACSVFEN